MPSKKMFKGMGKVIFWSYGRKGWQYDLMAGAIFLLVVLFPYGKELNGIEPKGRWSRVELKVEKEGLPLHFRKIASSRVVRKIEPITSEEGEIVGYKLLFEKRGKKGESKR
ncbi:MAG: hypothetical protein J7L64_06905 [Acidobacteria bacterium]|nr:hypothetical protein [Acidobacteriota bacterium]